MILEICKVKRSSSCQLRSGIFGWQLDCAAGQLGDTRPGHYLKLAAGMHGLDPLQQRRDGQMFLGVVHARALGADLQRCANPDPWRHFWAQIGGYWGSTRNSSLSSEIALELLILA
jgi:hypothetical protein